MRSNKSSVHQSKTFSRVLLALAAVVTGVSLSASADAGWFGAKGPGGAGVFTNRASAVRIVNPNGGNRLIGKPGGAGGKISDGGNRGGNDDGPRRRRLPKLPIIVTTPPAVTTITTPTPALGVVERSLSQKNRVGGGGNDSTSGQGAPRRITG